MKVKDKKNKKQMKQHVVGETKQKEDEHASTKEEIRIIKQRQYGRRNNESTNEGKNKKIKKQIGSDDVKKNI